METPTAQRVGKRTSADLDRLTLPQKAAVVWLSILGGAALLAAAVAVFGLVSIIERDVHLSAAARARPAAERANVRLEDFIFLRDRLPARSTFVLVQPIGATQSPLAGGGPRNFALYFLYPSVAVDDARDAAFVVGVDGATIDDAGIPLGRVERHGSVSIARVRRT